MNERFQVVYSDEALAFINSLPQKAKEKIAYNISKSMFITENSSRSWKAQKYGSSALYIMASSIGS